MIVAVLLSAGLSQRFGSAKALANLNGETVIERLQKMLIQTQVDQIIIVLGARADEIKAYLLNHRKVKFVYNKDYNFGQTSSFKAGLREIGEDAKGIFLLPVDYPLVGSKTVDDLIRHFWDRSPLIVLPSFNGKKGHPPLFSAKLKSEFLKLENESGVNAVARVHQEETDVLPVEDAGVVQTFNTPEEFAILRKKLETGD